VHKLCLRASHVLLWSPCGAQAPLARHYRKEERPFFKLLSRLVDKTEERTGLAVLEISLVLVLLFHRLCNCMSLTGYVQGLSVYVLGSMSLTGTSVGR
jgi:hypothetical protein